VIEKAYRNKAVHIEDPTNRYQFPDGTPIMRSIMPEEVEKWRAHYGSLGIEILPYA